MAAIGLTVALVASCSGSSGSDDATSTTEVVGTSTTTTAPTTTTTTVPPQPPSTVAAPATATATQPAQATSGPGSSALAHADWRESSGGEGADAWYVFEPVGPQPASAPVTIVLHGYYEFAGYQQLYELIRHTVLGGSIVIYPRWQVATVDPCAGPFDPEPCLEAALAGIRGAIDHLRSDPSRVQPELDEAAYFGFSFGGILTANLTNRWEELDLPEPAVIFFEDPHDSGLAGAGEPALDESLAGIPSTALVQCHSSAAGVISEEGKADSSCNALFPRLDHIPADQKDLVMIVPDAHGEPPLAAGHGVCASPKGLVDAYDWNFCWKVWDGLRAVAFDGADPAVALGDTAEHRSNGEWSDGTPIEPLRIQAEAPLRP